MKLSLSAKPRETDRRKVYYHGTATDKYVQQILREGIDPKFTEIKYGTKPPTMRPVANQVYVTPSPGYALIYALGGNFAGHDLPETHRGDPFGAVFAFTGDGLSDIGPDEDGVGLIAHLVLNRTPEAVLTTYWGTLDTKMLLKGTIPDYLRAHAPHDLTEKQYAAICGSKGAECIVQVQVGKKLLKIMPDDIKLAFIDCGAHVAHTGKLVPKAAFLIDKSRSKEYHKDGSNLASLSKRITL